MDPSIAMTSRRRRQGVPTTCLITACLLIASNFDPLHAFAPSSSSLGIKTPITLSARPPQDDGAGNLPPWRENQLYWEKREAERLGKLSSNDINIETQSNPSMQNSAQNVISNRNNSGNSIGNTFAHIYQQKSTDEFKKPFDEDDYDSAMNSSTTGKVMGDMTSAAPPRAAMPPAGRDQQQLPPPEATPPRTPKKLIENAANTFRHSFQTSSTDDFKRPHGMPDNNNMMQQRHSQPKQVFKAPFQTKSTDDFRGLSNAASQQQQRSESPAWKNQMGQVSFESTQLPNYSSYDTPLQNLANTIQPPQQKSRQSSSSSSSPKGFWEADNVSNARPQLSRATPPMLVSGSAAPITPEQQYVQPQQLQSNNLKSSNTLLHNIKWPLVRDPPGVSSDYPLLFTRVLVTIFATLSTRYMHLYNGFSPVLASSATTLLVSTCLDRRLGQAAFCGSFAGMSGGHLAPTLPIAVMLGALSSVSYEILIHINNLCLGIGGRLGASAFLATSIMAKYRGVASVGRKMRRGIWSSKGPSSIAVTMILYHMLGAVATIYLRESSDDSAAADPVRASSVVGLLSSLFVTDPTTVLALYGGTFVGMSLPSRLMYGNAPGNARAGQPQSALALFTSFAGAGAIAGLIHALLLHSGYWNGGWGGKAGLCAFAGCWVYRGIDNVYRFVNTKRR